ncbi:ATP-binding protein [Methylocapsa sp. D3K7]|uniref:sensor histidine kinase n=1 Tax=Methylocapsa sp. D3K7 TaxID=3041435 RepID=UPI00244EEB24|nr:ATP-binding protein [Methylocapsa sp. D3K7]WGJ13646.1 ATP-binding protein [Methylocapsa sp. D3K7]
MALGKLFRTTVFKISLAYLVISAIGAGLVLGTVGWNMKNVIDEQIAQTIDTNITGLSEQYAQGGIRRLVNIIQRRTRRPGAGLYLVTTAAGEPIAGNIATLPPAILANPGLVETAYQPPGDATGKHRALVRVFMLEGGFRLLVGHDLEEGDRLRNILANALLTSLFWLIVIGTLGGLWVARRVLNRVDAINANARAIVAGDLSGRLNLAGTDDELDRLVRNFNAMLERISILMAGLKEVSDNIAHDLKTPLTRLRGGVEQALRTAKSPEEYRGALEKALEESDRLIQVFDALLSIARAEAGAGREGMTDFDAGAVARDVGELYEPVAEERGVALRVSAGSDLTLHGSRELVGQAIANLVDNALKYGSLAAAKPDASVEITARRSGRNIEFVVADQGPGIAEIDRPRVLGRFVRLENARSRPGSGLGLSLAAAVARLHNGSLRLEDNGPGLRVVIQLPAVPVRREPEAPLALPKPDEAA